MLCLSKKNGRSDDEPERIFYTSGDLPKPELNKQHLRLYEYLLCPFASRARYALALKRIPFQDV